MALIPTLAASVYLNSAPIVYAFAEGTQASRCVLLADAAPARCARLLANATADGALIPAIEYQRIPDLAIARGVCVGARRVVRSVLLVAKRPLERIRSVALDTSSRTSIALVRIVLERFRRVTPLYTFMAPDLPSMLERADAALVIGDPAMTADTRAYDVYDMAELWREHTNLPFVFALWAVRPARIAPGALDFVAARSEGLEHAGLLADRYSRRLGLARAGLLEYITSHIHYELDEESLEGLGLFFRFAAEAELTPPAQPLRFWPD